LEVGREGVGGGRRREEGLRALEEGRAVEAISGGRRKRCGGCGRCSTVVQHDEGAVGTRVTTGQATCDGVHGPLLLVGG